MTETGVSSGRLRWNCRRGMRELDVLLSGFLDHRYPDLPPPLREQFARLLELQDPEIWSYLLGRSEPEPELADIVRHLRDLPAR